jgi:hypothetical protein
MERMYDNWLAAYVQHQRYSESPLSFHLWTGIATLAGALRRRVWIDERQFQWTPNMYIILVGPPGVAAKSTSLRAGLNLLEQVPGIFFGPQSMTWQALIDNFIQAQEAITLEGKEKPVPMSCLTIGVSELGTFLRPENREFLDLLTSMWDGQKEVLRRRTRSEGETTIHNPWLNVIGCTTPSWLKDNFPEVLIGGGLTSRIIFVYGDKKRQLVPYPSLLVTDSKYEEEEQNLVHDLRIIAELIGAYTLTKDAYDWGIAWYEKHNKGRPDHLTSERFAGYLSRKQTHIHKVAMVLAAAQRNELVITSDDLITADEQITELEHSMIQVFSSIGVSNTAKINTEVLSLIRNSRAISYKKLWRMCFATTAQKDFVDSIKAAIDAGYVKKESTGENDYILTYLGERK